VPELRGAPPEQVLENLTSISPLLASAVDPRRRTELALLQLELTNLIWPVPSAFNDDQIQAVYLSRAEAFSAAGKDEDARRMYSQLADRYPGDLLARQEYAEYLLSREAPQDLKQALDQWRRIAAKSRPRSNAWFRAKYSVALTQFKLDDAQSAARLIRYLQSTEDLAASGMESEFGELLRRCEKETEKRGAPVTAP
jgi:hypothetical protein